jgi:hypothetical protein
MVTSCTTRFYIQSLHFVYIDYMLMYEGRWLPLYLEMEMFLICSMFPVTEKHEGNSMASEASY